MANVVKTPEVYESASDSNVSLYVRSSDLSLNRDEGTKVDKMSSVSNVEVLDNEPMPGRHPKLRVLTFGEGEPEWLGPKEVEQKGHEWLVHSETLISWL